MATVQEVRASVDAQKRAIEQRQQQIRQTQLRELTRAELQTRTRTGLVQRELQRAQLAGAKRQALEQLEGPIQKQKQVESQLSSVESQQKQRDEFEAGRRRGGSINKQESKAFQAGQLAGRRKEFFLSQDTSQTLEQKRLDRIGALTTLGFLPEVPITFTPVVDKHIGNVIKNIQDTSEISIDSLTKIQTEAIGQFGPKGVPQRSTISGFVPTIPRPDIPFKESLPKVIESVKTKGKGITEKFDEAVQTTSPTLGFIGDKIGGDVGKNIAGFTPAQALTGGIKDVREVIQKTGDFLTGEGVSLNFGFGPTKTKFGLGFDETRELTLQDRTMFGSARGTVSAPPPEDTSFKFISIGPQQPFIGPIRPPEKPFTGKDSFGNIVLPPGKTTTLAKGIPGGLNFGLDLGVLAVPGVGGVVLAAEASEEFKNLNENAKKITEEQFKLHLETKVGEGERHLTREEFTTEVLPKVTSNLQNQKAVAIGVPLFFGATSVVGAGAKFGSSFVPKFKLAPFKGKLSTREIEKIIRVDELAIKKISAQEIALAKNQADALALTTSFKEVGKGVIKTSTAPKAFRFDSTKVSIDDLNKFFVSRTDSESLIKLGKGEKAPGVNLPDFKGALKFINKERQVPGPKSQSFQQQDQAGNIIQQTFTYNVGAKGQAKDIQLTLVKFPSKGGGKFVEGFTFRPGRKGPLKKPKPFGEEAIVEPINPTVFSNKFVAKTEQVALKELETGVVRRFSTIEKGFAGLPKELKPGKGKRVPKISVEKDIQDLNVFKTQKQLKKEFKKSVKFEEEKVVEEFVDKGVSGLINTEVGLTAPKIKIEGGITNKGIGDVVIKKIDITTPKIQGKILTTPVKTQSLATVSKGTTTPLIKQIEVPSGALEGVPSPILVTQIKTPLSKTFPPTFIGPQLPPKIAKELEQKQIAVITKKELVQLSLPKAIIKPKPKPQVTIPRPKITKGQSRDLIGLPRGVGGLGLTEAQIKRAQGTIITEVESTNLPLNLVSSSRRDVGNLLNAKPGVALFDQQNLSVLNKDLQEGKGIQDLSFKSQQLLKTGLESEVIQKQLQENQIKFQQDFRQDQRLNQESKQDQRFKQEVKQELKQEFKQKQRQRQKQTLKPKLSSKRPRLPKRPKRIPTPFLPSTSTAKALLKLREKGLGVDVEVGQKIGKKRTIARNVHPFRGLAIGRKFVDRNIEASYRLKRSGKKAKGKKGKKQNVGEKFRASKRNALFVVEKKKFRLDKSGEKRQIKKSQKRKR